MMAFERLLNVRWTHTNPLTGLYEYRNGGLFVDTGVLTLKPDIYSQGLLSSTEKIPSFDATSDVVVEWRALTAALLDKIHELVNQKLIQSLGSCPKLILAQVLEAGTWKCGQELAFGYRPQTMSSPIHILDSAGTLF